MKLQTLRERRARIAAGETSHEAVLAQALEAGDVAALQVRLKDAPEAEIAAAVEALTR